MNSKIMSIISLCLLTLCISTSANAGLIVGDVYSDIDDANIQWEYVGSYDLTDGPDLFQDENIIPVNGIGAAELIFGILSANEQYGLSSNSVDDYKNIENFIVNRHAWYDSFDVSTSVHEAKENEKANHGGSEYYDTAGDISAYIWDRAEQGKHINHVFKTVSVASVPEPTTLAILLIKLTTFVPK